jgi:hypothetical protein
MYFAKESLHNEFYSYQRLINDVIENNTDERFKSFLDEIIKTTHSLVINEIQQDNVNHKFYDLVIALADYEKKYTREFFKNIDPNQISESDYLTVESILSSIIHDPELNNNELQQG